MRREPGFREPSNFYCLPGRVGGSLIGLDETGRHAINSAVARVVDSLPDHLVIVEGYSGTGTPDQQFVMSRRRAVLVREYL